MDDGGYFLVLDKSEPRRRDGLIEIIEASGTFTQPVSTPDWRMKTAEIVVLSLGEEAVHYLALAERTGTGGTLLERLRLSHFRAVTPPAAISAVAERMSTRLGPHLVRTSGGDGSRIPPRTWAELQRALTALRPETAESFAELRRLREMGRGGEQPSLRVAPAIIYEKDAVNLATRFAGVGSEQLLSWTDDYSRGAAPFLRGLSTVPLREDTMIQHDTNVFGDWKYLRSSQVGSVVLTKGRRRLHVINVNRTPLEGVLGVDLIYYDEQYRSYVMVQYKRLKEESAVWGYRPDAQYELEVARMNDFATHFDSNEDCVHPRDFRLHCGPFYFKLCQAATLDPASSEMIKGMYLPLDYWKLVVSTEESRGPQGGRRVTYESAGRYMNNELFVKLVQAGWIGSRAKDTAILTQVIQSALAGKRSVILARSSAG